jgi:enoyl-CoA hydratase/carnithine racemase
MSIIDYTLDESVAIITMNNGENRFNPDFLEAFLNVLDTIENETEAKTVIVTSAHEKIFTNGLDLEWLVPIIQKGEVKTAQDFFFKLNVLFKRVVTYPMITIAAISGHAFAGGAIFTGAFDFRFMRSDRGFFCLPEVDLGIPFLPGMLALLGKAIPAYKFNEMQYTGMRLTAKDCEDHHIVLKALHIDDLMKETLAFAKGLNKNRNTVKEMKKRMNRHIVHCLDVEDVPYIESGKFNI